MKRFEIFCPRCGNGLGRHRVASEVGGASDFECTGCGISFSLTEKENGKSMEIFLISAEKPEESFCPICGPKRSTKYTIINGGFTCFNQKCNKTFIVMYEA